MFYSHEVLTSRKYGVATVWLVATLGSKSNLKRINRKQILDVDVAKACQTIVDPVAPMALRLQGNLLYGISRVYSQQCGYALSDAQNAHNAMRMLLHSVKNLALDPDAGKARPEQLLIPDDPSFLPEFALPPPEVLAAVNLGLNFDVTHSGESQSLTPFGSQHSQSSTHGSILGGLVLPSSSPAPTGRFNRKVNDDQLAFAALLDTHTSFQISDPEFTFDDDGALIEGPSVQTAVKTPMALVKAPMLSDSDISAKVRQDYEEGQMGGAQLPLDHMEVDLPLLGDDLPEGEAFSGGGQQESSDMSELVQSTSTTSAPMRQRRAARVLPFDTRMELRNKDLADWNANYLENMSTAIAAKNRSRVAKQAKRDAEEFVWGNGLGRIAHQYLGIPGPNPFDMYIGDSLFECITGTSRKKMPKRRHDRDSGIDDETQEESRRVRQKMTDPGEEVGRGQDDEALSMPGDHEIELPREAISALDDQQMFSAMPWNLSASIRGSSAIPRSVHVGTGHGKPGSRLVSASPLLGRGQSLGLEALQIMESDGILGDFGDEVALPGPSSPATLVGIPPEPLARVKEALSTEGENFLLFVGEAIDEKRRRTQAGIITTSDEVNEISFEELLPISDTSSMIACQGFMMVLCLGTQGLLDVQQDGYLTEIHLKLTERAKASNIIQISEGKEGKEGKDGATDEMEVNAGINRVPSDQILVEQGGGHFEEQLAAGHAGQQEDDQDSLYDG